MEFRDDFPSNEWDATFCVVSYMDYNGESNPFAYRNVMQKDGPLNHREFEHPQDCSIRTSSVRPGVHQHFFPV